MPSLLVHLPDRKKNPSNCLRRVLLACTDVMYDLTNFRHFQCGSHTLVHLPSEFTLDIHCTSSDTPVLTKSKSYSLYQRDVHSLRIFQLRYQCEPRVKDSNAEVSCHCVTHFRKVFSLCVHMTWRKVASIVAINFNPIFFIVFHQFLVPECGLVEVLHLSMVEMSAEYSSSCRQTVCPTSIVQLPRQDSLC